MTRFALGLLIAFFLTALPGSVELEEWRVPFGGHPRDSRVHAAGKVWFVGQLDPKSGECTEAGTISRAKLP